MINSDFGDDPFLAVSDYSEDEKAIQDINAFLNAPSSVVVKKKPNNQMGQTANPSTSTTNISLTNTHPTKSNNFNQPSSPKKGSIQFESSVFELPSFDSSENSKNEQNVVDPLKVINDFNSSQKKTNDINPSSSPKKKDIKRSTAQKRNLLSNQELMKAFLNPDNTNNENDAKQAESKSSDSISKSSKKENEESNFNNSVKKETKNENEEKSKKSVSKKKNFAKQKDSSPLDFLAKLDLDTTEVDPDNNESKPNDKKTDWSIFPQNSTTSHKENRPKLYYITPKTPIEAFEYSFLRYLEDASDDLRLGFSEEFQSIVEQNLDFQNNIQEFIMNLNHELRSIFENGIASLDLEHNHLEYDTDYISTFFQSLSSSLKNQNFSPTDKLKPVFDSPSFESRTQSNLQNLSLSKIYDFNNNTINADLIQALTTSFVTNSKSILSDLQNNLTELLDMQPEIRRTEEERMQNIYNQKMQKRFDLEGQELQLNIEKSYISQRLENIKRISNTEINTDLYATPYSPNKREYEEFIELNEEIDEIVQNLKSFDSKKLTSPFTSFSKRVKSISEDLLILNAQLSNKTKIVSRSLSLNKNSFMPSVMQPSNMSMQLPLTLTNFDLSNQYVIPDYQNRSTLSAEYDNAQIINNYKTASNNQIAIDVEDRLANLKQLRENQIAKVHELISEIQ